MKVTPRGRDGATSAARWALRPPLPGFAMSIATVGSAARTIASPGARLFAVADTYDAITSDRPYRRAAPHDAAVAEIRRVAGTQLDPDVVEAFCRLPESEWTAIRAEVEQISLLEAQWGWTPPKRVFDAVRDAATKQRGLVREVAVKKPHTA